MTSDKEKIKKAADILYPLTTHGSDSDDEKQKTINAAHEMLEWGEGDES